jgi:hypothetical protein
MSLIVGGNLFPVIGTVENSLVRAENACAALRSRHDGSSSQALAQLDQALHDGIELVQREYSHYMDQGSKGKMTDVAFAELWNTCVMIQNDIVKPLEDLARDTHNHGHHHHHDHHDHHWGHCHHSCHTVLTPTGLVRKHHINCTYHAGHHNHQTDFETRILAALREWNLAKGQIEHYFDMMEKGKGSTSKSGDDDSKTDPIKKVRTAVKGFVEAAENVDEELVLITKAHDKIHGMGCKRRRHSHCSSSSSSC